MVTATTSFFTNAWPAIVGLTLLIVFAMIAWRLGLRAVHRIARGRG